MISSNFSIEPGIQAIEMQTFSPNKLKLISVLTCFETLVSVSICLSFNQHSISCVGSMMLDL